MAASPVIELVNAPVAAIAPCSVLVANATVGLVEVLHTTPYWVRVISPKKVIFPFTVAVVEVMLLTSGVVTVGAIGLVANVTSVP